MKKIKCSHPPSQGGTLVYVSEVTTTDKLPADLTAMNPDLRKGFCIYMVFVGANFNPFIHVQNAKSGSIQAWKDEIGKRVEFVCKEERQSNPAPKPDAVPEVLPLGDSDA